MKEKSSYSYAIKNIIKIVFILLLNIVVISFAFHRHNETVQTLSKYGSSGTEVIQIQSELTAQGYYSSKIDGKYGPKTKNAVINFQKVNGLAPDGVTGSKTLYALGISTNNSRTSRVQTKLKSLGIYKGNVDGIYGPKTKDAVISFQKQKNLSPDGIVGPKTLAALNVQTDSQVHQIQNKLKNWGFYQGNIDGIYGPKTKAAVIEFQKKHNLKADGIVGTNTLNALGIAGTSQMYQIQTKLADMGLYNGNIDGIYGSRTRASIIEFQKREGLSADGIIGPKTLAKLGFASSTTNNSNFTSSDVSLLARVISAEARGEPYNGQVAVGAVLLNRIEHPSFPNTLSGVVYQPGAFSCLIDGQFNESVSDSAKRAAQDAINGLDPSGGAIYYYNPAKSTNKWIFSRPVITVIGSHRFCN